MSIDGISSSKMAKLSPADIKAMIVDRNQVMRGYQAGIENPDEKNLATKDIFTQKKDKVSSELSELKELLAQAQSNPNQASAVNQDEKKGQKLNLIA